MKRSILALTLGAAALLTPLSAHAAPIVDHGALDLAIQSFTGHPLGTPGGAAAPVDRRLRLEPCAADVTLTWRSPNRDTVVLECKIGVTWKLFVPVVPNAVVQTSAVAAAAPAEAPVSVIAKGDVVTIEIRGTGFTINQGGQAMDAGPVGSWIRIKTAGKGEVLTAQILRRGLVSMSTP